MSTEPGLLLQAEGMCGGREVLGVVGGHVQPGKSSWRKGILSCVMKGE